jgi:phage terminase large subunit GpA-like protein
MITVDRFTAAPEIYEGIAVATRQRERISVSEWANRNRYFRHGQSFKSQDADARYSTDDAPFQREPQDELTNPEVQTHVWMMASRIAKTVMLGNAFGYFAEHDPATQLFMYPTQEDADLRSREEFQPVIDASPVLRGTFADVKGGSGDNTIAFKKFVGGSAAFIGSNAPSKLRARTARAVFADEADAYRPSSGKEGDPLALLFNRAKNYQRPVRVIASTPTIKNHSRIEDWYLKSDQRKWFCKCQKCGEWQTLKWARFKWPPDDRSACRYHCEVCDYAHNDRERERMIRGGEWRPTAPFTGIRGYWLPGYYNIFPAAQAYKGKMHEMVEAFFAASHSHDKRQTMLVLTNTFFCESFQEESDITPEWKPLFDRREDYGRETLPKEIVVVTFGTDFQSDRIEVVFWGHGRDEEKWRIEKHVLHGDPRMPEIYQRLEGLLLRTFKREDGAILRAKAGGFDTGYAACIRRLYEWIRPRQRFNWFAFKGSSQVDADMVRRAARSKVDRVTLLMVGVNRIKALIYNRAVLTNAGPNYLHFSEEMQPEDFEQLFAEQSRSVIKAGVQYKQFELPPGQQNEELDCAVLAHAAFYARGMPNYDFEERLNLATIPIPGGEQKKKQVARSVRDDPFDRRGDRGGLGRGWNI